jgi:hypothetical protein
MMMVMIITLTTIVGNHAGLGQCRGRFGPQLQYCHRQEGAMFAGKLFHIEVLVVEVLIVCQGLQIPKHPSFFIQQHLP